MTAPTIAEQVAAVLPCQNISAMAYAVDCYSDDPMRCVSCKRRPAVLALLEAVRREAIVECAVICDDWHDDPVAAQLAVNIHALLEKP